MSIQLPSERAFLPFGLCMPQTKRKILIIDYEPRGIKQMYEPLKNAGHEILLAKDGITGLEVFLKEKPDLVLIEAMLPKRHGFDVCLDMKRSEHGSTPVVIVTSVYKGRKYRTQAIHQYKCDEYLEKPLTADNVLETVDLMLPDDETPAQVAPAEETAPPSPAAPQPVADAAPSDRTEEEISDRLNEILFGSEDSDDSKHSA